MKTRPARALPYPFRSVWIGSPPRRRLDRDDEDIDALDLDVGWAPDGAVRPHVRADPVLEVSRILDRNPGCYLRLRAEDEVAASLELGRGPVRVPVAEPEDMPARTEPVIRVAAQVVLTLPLDDVGLRLTCRRGDDRLDERHQLRIRAERAGALETERHVR